MGSAVLVVRSSERRGFFWVFLFSFLQEVAVSFSGSALPCVRKLFSLFWADLSSSSRLMKDPERG